MTSYSRLQRILIVGCLSMAAAFGWFIVQAPLGSNTACAQTLLGCPPQASDCLGYFRFNPPMQVKYYIYPNDFNINQKSQIKSGFSKWKTASATTCLAVNFVEVFDASEALVTVQKRTSLGTEVELGLASDNTVASVIIWFDFSQFNATQPGYDTVFLKGTLHEIGHSMGLDHAPSPQTAGKSVMNGRSGINDSNNLTPTDVQPCDKQSVNQNPQCPTPTPTPSPTPTPTPDTEEECEQAGLYWNFSESTCNSTPQECPGYCEEQGGIDLDLCQYEFGCPQGFQAGDSRTGLCCFPAPCPVVVDVDGSGFQFTNAINGVNFDIDGDGNLDHISWTSGSSTNAWLVLDRNGNGVIDNGTELFGNVTQQTVPRGEQPNGFLALSKYDRPSEGGNGDGLITSADAIFSSLRLWQDVNHNGISESGELHPLATAGITALELDYKESKRIDEEGNHFRYRAKVKNAQGQQLGRWAWDVFLLRR